MRQKKKNGKPNRLILWEIFWLIGFVLVLMLVISMADIVYYGTSAPIVTPQHSAQELWDDPLPIPDWILSVPTKYDNTRGSNKSTCVSLIRANIWDWEHEDREQTIKSTTSISVDRVNVSRHDMEFWTVSGYQLNCVNCNIDFDDEPNYVCFDLPNIDAGLHVATIRLESNSGQVYCHEWAFQVMD